MRRSRGAVGAAGFPRLPRLERQRIGTHGVGLVVPRHGVCQRAQGQCAGEAIRRARAADGRRTGGGTVRYAHHAGRSQRALEPCEQARQGGGMSCGVQCCASVMQWMWCSPRAVRASVLGSQNRPRGDHGRARSRRTGRPWAAWARMCFVLSSSCSWLAPGVQLLTLPPRGAPVASCRVRARTEGALAWAGRGVAGTESEGRRRKNALQQRSASVRKSAASAFFFYGRYHSIEAVSAEADTHCPVCVCFFTTRVRRTTTTARLRRSEPAPPF